MIQVDDKKQFEEHSTEEILESELALWVKPEIVVIELIQTESGAEYIYEGDGGDPSGYYS